MVDVGPAEFFWLDQEWQGCSFSHTAHCHHGRRWREQQWLFCLNYYLLMCTHIRNNVLSHSFDQSFCFFFLSVHKQCPLFWPILLLLFFQLFFGLCRNNVLSFDQSFGFFKRFLYFVCVCGVEVLRMGKKCINHWSIMGRKCINHLSISH